MGYRNERITAPVSISDCQKALGESSNDLGTLCKSSKINMWARYKPIRTTSDIVRPVLYRERKAQNFGLELPWCTDYTLNKGNGQNYKCLLNGMAHAISYREEGSEDLGWKYLPPRGDRTSQKGVREFYRLSDFARHPSQTTQDSDAQQGDPTPVNLQGYSHNAPFPVSVYIGGVGVSLKASDRDFGNYYEINKTLTETLTVKFINSIGDDLHLQDFVTISNTVDSYGRSWRPVLQLFQDEKKYSQTEPELQYDWYKRSRAEFEVAGDPISEDAGSDSSVSLDLSILDTNQYYHMCIGIGNVNTSFKNWGEGNNLFIPPYTEEQVDEAEVPFYAVIKVVEHDERRLAITALQYKNPNSTSPNWPELEADSDSPTFHIPQNAVQQARLIFTLSEIQGQSLSFVGENGYASAPNSQLRIRMLRIKGNESPTKAYLTPAEINAYGKWQSADYVNIPGDSTGTPVTLHATFYIWDQNSPLYAGEHITYQIQTSVNGNNWQEASSSMVIYMNN